VSHCQSRIRRRAGANTRPYSSLLGSVNSSYIGT